MNNSQHRTGTLVNCENCGVALANSPAGFCSLCGAAIARGPAIPTLDKKKLRGILVLLALAAAGGIVLLTKDESMPSNGPAPIVRGPAYNEVGNPSKLAAKPAVQLPTVTANDVVQGTPKTVYELPSVYAHRYVLLDEWKNAWLSKSQASRLPPGALPRTIPDCDWYLPFTLNSGACLSSAEVAHLKQMAKDEKNSWGLPTADLLCYVQVARFAQGFLLTHCRPIPIPIDIELSRENQRDREEELQHALTDMQF